MKEIGIMSPEYSEVGKFLHLGPTGVSLAARRGEKILKSDPAVLKEIMGSIDK